MAAAVGTTARSEHFQTDSAEMQSTDSARKCSEENPEKSSESQPPTSDNNSDPGGPESNEGKKDSDDKAQSKVKKFDNKTFVEAPIPKTNPWNKGKGQAAPPKPVPIVPVTKAAPVPVPVSPVQAPTVKKESVPVESSKPLTATTESSESNKPRVTTQKSLPLSDENWPALNETTESPGTKKPMPMKSLSGLPQQPPATQQSPPAQVDSGGDDSAKENKENAEGQKTPKNRKGKKESKQKWVPLDIEPPKSGRRSRSQGRLPPRRESAKAQDRLNKGGDKREDIRGENSATCVSPHNLLIPVHIYCEWL